MRVLFIYPNINTQVGFNYGISYISGLLKSRGIETTLLNVNEKLGYPLDLDRIKEDILKIQPDVIGFSVLTNQYKYALQIAGDIKTYSDVPIVFGGIHVTMDPLETLSQPAVDIICIGEGEEAFLELVERQNPEGILNLGYKKNGKPVIEALRPYTDIINLPFKDYEIFDFQQIIDAKDGWVGLTASRGCPFHCTYCLNHKIMSLYKENGHLPKHYIRRHTVDQMIGEIEYLLGQYKNIKMFIFDDDIFTFDKAWLTEFTRRYREVTDIGFVCNAHARVFDEETAAALSQAGCRIVKFGIESGSDRIRRSVLHRYMTNDHIAESIAAAHKYGLHTSCFVMIGLPHEKKEDLIETVRLLGDVKPGRVRWTLFFPFIGTKAYDIAKESGQIDFVKMNDLDNFTDETCMIFDDEETLLLNKMKDNFCLFLNGYSNTDGEGRYRELVETLEALDRKRFSEEVATVQSTAEKLNAEMEEKGKPYYAVRYNAFMGVRSDWKDDNPSA